MADEDDFKKTHPLTVKVVGPLIDVHAKVLSKINGGPGGLGALPIFFGLGLVLAIVSAPAWIPAYGIDEVRLRLKTRRK